MRHRVSVVQAEKLAQDLKDLATRGDDELKERWRNLYGTEPPRKIHRSLLIPAIAYRIQENALGALKPSVRRHLMRVTSNTAEGPQAPGYPSLSLKLGTVLVAVFPPQRRPEPLFGSKRNHKSRAHVRISGDSPEMAEK